MYILSDTAKREIQKAGRVTDSMRENEFCNVEWQLIRDTLEENGLDRHMPIELRSTEIAVVTPLGIMMQIRPEDDNKLGVWGGLLEDGEFTKECAVRRLFEETGIFVEREQLTFAGVEEHLHEYANGDKVIFESYRYVLKLYKIPVLDPSAEATGVVFIKSVNEKILKQLIEHQKSFIDKVIRTVKL